MCPRLHPRPRRFLRTCLSNFLRLTRSCPSLCPLPEGHEMASKALKLPFENSLQAVSGQGWRCATSVRQSKIAGAGNGRFAEELVKQGTCLSVKPLVRMAAIDSLVALPADRVISFSDADDLERYINFNESEGGHSRGEVLNLFQNFVWSLDGRRAYLCGSTWSMNHAHEEGLNVQKLERDGAIVGEALVDIAVGDELRNNYKEFDLPDFYIRYCGDNGIRDVRSLVMEAIRTA